MTQTNQTALQVLSGVAFPGLMFDLLWNETAEDYRLRVRCPTGTCNVTTKPMPWTGRWWRLSEHMTDSEIVWTAFKAVLTALEHEARERFTFKGVPVANSHVDIHALAAFMADPSNHDNRKDPTHV